MNSQYIITRIIFLFEKIYLNKLWPKCKRKYVFGMSNTNYTIYKYHKECNFFYDDKSSEIYLNSRISFLLKYIPWHHLIQRKEIDSKHSLVT